MRNENNNKTTSQKETTMNAIKVTSAEGIIRRRVNRFWIDRALEMFRHMTESHLTITTISNLKIATGWPDLGCISFTRDADGKRIKLLLNRGKFIASAV